MKNLCSDVPSGPPYIWHVNFVTRFFVDCAEYKVISHLSNLLLREPQRAQVIEEIHRCVFQTPPQHEARARETDWATEHVVQRFQKKYFLREEKYFLWKKIFLAEKNISCGKKYISCGEKFISCGEKFISRGKNIFLAEKNIFLAEKNISCGKKYISCRKIFLYHVTNKLP